MANVKIKVLENGPYLIEGSGTYTDADGATQQTPGKSVALCRCGQSGNLPFCDGSHKACGFNGGATEVDIETS